MTHGKRPIKGVRGTCESGKVRFGTKAAATEALESALHSKDAARTESRSYWCRRCAGFHLSSKPRLWRTLASLSCASQSPDGFPCSLARGHGPDHEFESPCPDEVPNVKWSDA